MIKTYRLKTESLIATRGIVVPDPEFSWALAADCQGQCQKACEIQVDRLMPDGRRIPVWRSGKLDRRIGHAVRYAGQTLASRSDYRWRVRVYNDEEQCSDWSSWATFETGVMAPDKITAKWITGGGALRRVLKVDKDLVRARAYVSGLGYYEFFCNGVKVSAAILAPSFTEFDRRVEYETIDLTEQLNRGGAHCVGFLLANGWWRHDDKPWAQRSNQALAEIVLEYADGRREILSTNETWQAAHGPLIADENQSTRQFFDGVALDLGWLASGWCEAGAGNEDWQSAKLVDATEDAGPDDQLQTVKTVPGQLVPTQLPPVREIRTLKPVSIKRLSDTLLSVDLGQNYTGHLRFKANASKGTRMTMRHAELLHPDGRLNPNTQRTAKQTDTFLLAGIAGETVEPRFVHHGLRYAQIQGPVDQIDLDSIEGVVVHTDLEQIGTVTTSDDRINWLLNAVQWTVRSNAMSVMTDVCARGERRGWLMDGFTGFKAGLLHYDMVAMARKWFTDIIDNQQDDGSLRGDMAPFWFASRSVGWQRAIVLLPWVIYEYYGDRSLLKRAFTHMCRYADFLIANLKDDLLPVGFSLHPLEWLCIGKQNNQLSDNAAALDVLRKVAQAAEVLGEDSTRYTQIADRMAMAAHNRWSKPGSGSFGGSGGQTYAQSNQVFALRFGLADSEISQDVFDSLVFDLMHARGEGPFVTTGIGCTEHLPMVLSDFGRDDIVWKWLQRDTYPGYGFMHKHDATTLWECWDYRIEEAMNAHNHTGMIGIGTWLLQRLVGIQIQPGPQPVFDLHPAVHLPLQTLEAHWQSRWGEIAINWQTNEQGKILNVLIPPGCRGMLKLHGKSEILPLDPGKHQINV
ncbi:MAG TPA: hypothetical protein DER01_19175 [Phycisphaerales bacterium]|nr:hypothetical protein [Phycisphaerales bacterium]|tara:strand:+ start:44478 stop:47042 length:2565 start_codon:yes stop_codon:yes gene_type:complete